MAKRTPNRLLTDAFREIRHTRSRFVSLMVLSALAVCFLAGLRATAPDMKKSADSYFDQQNLMDLRIVSTLGLTEEDAAALAGSQSGVFVVGADDFVAVGAIQVEDGVASTGDGLGVVGAGEALALLQNHAAQPGTLLRHGGAGAQAQQAEQKGEALKGKPLVLHPRRAPFLHIRDIKI